MTTIMVLLALWVLFVILGLMFMAGASMIESRCTNDCNQGRTCICKEPMNGDQRLTSEGVLEQYKEGSWVKVV